jgi:hypothetical protein
VTVYSEEYAATRHSAAVTLHRSGCSFEVIGRMLHISAERARQIVRRGLARERTEPVRVSFVDVHPLVRYRDVLSDLWPDG